MNRAVRLTTFVVLLLAVLGADSAAAGTYTVWSCRGPAGAPAATSAWSGDGIDSCANDGALRAVAGHPGDRDGYRFEAPAGTAITGYRIWRYAEAGGYLGWGSYAALLQEPSSGPADACVAQLGCTRVGDSARPLAAANEVSRSGIRADALSTEARCLWICPGAEFRLFRAAVELTDASPPVRTGTVAIGDGTAALTATDVGGGVRSAQVLIDGTPAGSAGAGCAEPYTAPRPCPSTYSFRVGFDTTALADGEHELAVVVSDAAGNAATLATQTLTISRPAPLPTPDPVPAPAPAPPSAPAPVVEPPARADRLSVPRTRFAPGARGTISGRATRNGVAVAGIPVTVDRRYYGPRAAWQRIKTLTTGANGSFSLRVPAVPQQLRFRGGDLVRTVNVVSRLRVSAKVRPGLVRNGAAIALTGRIAGAGPAARGAAVEIQAMIGGRWTKVATVRATAAGDFRWRYRFENTRLEALYSFRARVSDSSARWPWPATASARVKVHVIP